jgi:hypothetical protein
MEAHMQKRIYFAIATAIMGLALGFWIKPSVVQSKGDDVAQPKFELSSPNVKPYLPVQTLEPVY